MTASTRKLHESLIRIAKAAIGAWEIWLKERAGQQE